ncbi:MAG: succinylglutamate desuccinylase/aspartoacylase family protein [Candidatus Thorarchaeota archaeon]
MARYRSFKEPMGIDFELPELRFSEIPFGISYGLIDIFEDRFGQRIGVPTLVAKGTNVEHNPVLGLTAAIHGNELNGIQVIHKLFEEITNYILSGIVVAIPIVNVPGYLGYNRTFIDGVDLNRIMPGCEDGRPSEEYAFHFMRRIVEKFDYLLDFHTASFGRTNSHYIRGDLSLDSTANLLKLQHADIVLHTKGPEGSLRNAAVALGIPAITIELGNPQRFQKKFHTRALTSVLNTMSYLGMIEEEIIPPNPPPIVCERSYWVRCHDGGILTVHPGLGRKVYTGERIATLKDIYGRKDIVYKAPEDGIVIGKNVNPVVSTGGRIIHLGILSTQKNWKTFAK